MNALVETDTPKKQKTNYIPAEIRKRITYFGREYQLRVCEKTNKHLLVLLDMDVILVDNIELLLLQSNHACVGTPQNTLSKAYNCVIVSALETILLCFREILS